MLQHKLSFPVISWSILSLLLSVTSAQSIDTKVSKGEPFVIIADTLDYNDQTNVVTAKGNVYVSHNGQLLYADSLEYNKLTDTLYAQGNVWIKDKDKNFSFADTAELKNKFDDGFIQNAKMLMTDDSRLAAATAQKLKDEKVILRNGVYSPCPVCKTDKVSFPLWQLRSNKVIHDKKNHEMIYHHAFMDFGGIPLLYTPYFFHPDSTVKRKTGLLAPIFGQSKDLGFIISQPVFININQNSDVTLYPIFTRKEGPIIGAEYRHLFSAVSFQLNASYAGNSHNNNALENNPNAYRIPGKHRWHAFLDLRAELTPEILLTTKIHRASDLTYLKRYPITISNLSPLEIQTALTSMIAVEQFKSTSYGMIKGYVFQADNKKSTPYIYPFALYTYETMPGKYGQTYGASVNILNLSREEAIAGLVGKKETRGSLETYAQIPYTTQWGDIWQAKVKARMDAYSVSEFQPLSPNTQQLLPPQDTYRQRFFPQASLNWRYPFIKFFEASQWVIEPAAMAVTGSQGGNSIYIPNEDTPFVNLDATNLYLLNRFSGIDRLDTGTRLVYGFHSRNYWTEHRHIFLFLGQTKRLDRQTALLPSSGEDHKGSGIVGKIDFKPFSFIQFQSRFILSKKQLRPDVAESALSFITPYATVSANHVYFTKEYSSLRTLQNPQAGTETSQFNWQLQTASYKNVTVGFGEIRNLKEPSGKKQLLSRTISFTHVHDCLTTTVSVMRTGFQDRDLQPNTVFLVQFVFKNLGVVTPINMLGVMNPLEANGMQTGR